MKNFDRVLGVVLACCYGLALAAAGEEPARTCSVDTGSQRNTLLELYTSEGCSSCPPAERFLGTLGLHSKARFQPTVIPLAFHVDYWDDLGWRDPYAQAAFSQRHAWLVAVNGQRTKYTPHFFVNAQQVDDWRADLAERLRLAAQQAGRPAVRLQLEQRMPESHRAGAPGAELAVSLAVRALQPGDMPPHDVQWAVALAQNKLTSQVRAGENQGVRLHHDHVVRLWSGLLPLKLARGGAQTIATGSFRLQPDWPLDQLELVGFVQDASNGEIIQAVSTPLCSP